MIQAENEYPIFWFSLEFDDRLWNVSTDRMFPEMLSEDEQQAYLEEFVNVTLDATAREPTLREQVRAGRLQIVKTEVRFRRMDTWCEGWFQHYTLNTNLSDEELLRSFERYVRKHHLVHTLGEHEDPKIYFKRVSWEDRVSLMGAEDRWRWKGPCRCEHCQARGIVMIDH